ncbi:MAG: hypothetical protein ABI781_04195 [Burkholderiales bacterium]
MAIVHVRLDVDSEVYPELYTILAPLDRAASRSERVRQLASSGLIWEYLRVHGPTRTSVDIDVGNQEVVTEKSVASQPVPPPIDPTPPTPPVPPPPKMPAKLPAATAQRIAADPENTTGGSKRAALPRASPPSDVPTLYDAVELKETDAGTGAPESAQAAHPSAPVESAPQPARKTGPKPRLMRMKEKGLFSNG